MKEILQATDIYQVGYRWLVVTADGQRVDITDALERNHLALSTVSTTGQAGGFMLLERC